jgi:hypothetical protein
MTKLEDLLPDTEAEWTCGHVGGVVCRECYRLLAAKAHELAEENERLREALWQIKEESEAYLPMRTIVERVGKIAREACQLPGPPGTTAGETRK